MLTVILSSYPECGVVELIFNRHCIVRDSVVKFWGENNKEINLPPYLLLFPCLSVAKWFGINLSCQSLSCIEDWSQNASALDLFQNFPPPCLSNEARDRIAGANLISSSSNNPTAKTKSYKLCSVLKGMAVSNALYIALLFYNFHKYKMIVKRYKYRNTFEYKIQKMSSLHDGRQPSMHFTSQFCFQKYKNVKYTNTRKLCFYRMMNTNILYTELLRCNLSVNFKATQEKSIFEKLLWCLLYWSEMSKMFHYITFARIAAVYLLCLKCQFCSRQSNWKNGDTQFVK